MIELIRKTILAGIGAAVLSKEKIELSLKELVEKGKLSTEEAKEMASKIASDGKEEFERVSQDLRENLNDLLEKAGVGQKERVDALEKRLLDLEVEVANLTTKLSE